MGLRPQGNIVFTLAQTVLVVVFAPDDDDPSNTLGLRLAILSAAVIAVPSCVLSIRWMKYRPGLKLPEGAAYVAFDA